MYVSEPYRDRSIEFHEIRSHGGWRIKIYSVLYGTAPLDWNTIEEGFALSFTRLPDHAQESDRPGVAFAIAHQGRGMHYVVISWWGNENEYFNRVLVRPFGAKEKWRNASEHESVCVWDLQIICFEREAYVATILAKEGTPDIDAYVSLHLKNPQSTAR